MSHSGAQSQSADLDNSFNFASSPGAGAVGGQFGKRDRRRASGAAEAGRRAANRDDERFLRQEKLIQHELERALAKRRIGLKASELCRDAEMSRSTFYAHYKSCDEALFWYELRLEEEFVRSLPQNLRRELAFVRLFSFISKHQQYFSATFQNQNMFLLARLVKHVCAPRAELNQKAYVLYVWSVQAMIWCWGECDNFSAAKAEVYRKKLMMLRVMDYGL